MTKLSDLRPGDIVHVTKWSEDIVDGWGVITEEEESAGYTYVMFLHAIGFNKTWLDDSYPLDDLSDTWERPAVEDVPDDIWTRLAVYQLTGERDFC